MTVSVCVPLYRPRFDWLLELADGVAAQGAAAGELVLREEPSDRPLTTAELAELREHARAPVRHTVNDHRLGMAANWNAALADATARYAVLLGQDDALAPGALATVMSFAEARPLLPFVAYGRTLVDDAGAPVTAWRPGSDRAWLYEPGCAYVLPSDIAIGLTLRTGLALGEPCAVLVRRDAFSTAGGYDPEFGHMADVELLLRLLGTAPACGYIALDLARRRVHHAALTAENIVDGVAARDRRELYRRYAPTVPSTLPMRSRWRAYVASRELLAAAKTARSGRPGRAVVTAGRAAGWGLTVLPWSWYEVARELRPGWHGDADAVRSHVVARDVRIADGPQ